MSKKRCRICKSDNNVNKAGRCHLCQTAQDAVEAGMSYGKLVALREMTAPLSPLERLLAGIDDGAAKTQTCRWCGTVFLVTNRNKAYCSDECRKAQNDAWGRERKARGGTLVLEDRPCVICGVVFMPKVVQQITCGPECSRARRHEMAKDLRQRARERQKCAKTKEDA